MKDGTILSVVMFSAEAIPYIKVGGLADVVGALPGVLESLGAKLTLVLPSYKAVPREKFGIQPSEQVASFDVPIGSRMVSAEVSQARMPGTGIDVYFLDGGNYFSRNGIYDDPASKEGFADNMDRFVFFTKAGLELLRSLGRSFDVIHCHDSQTALIPGLLRTVLRDDPFYARTGTLLTIHNLAYQGLYGREALDLAGIDSSLFYPTSPFEYWGKVNFMKVGIETSDLVNTVSEGYAREIQSSAEYGYGLEGVLRNRARDLSGIVNGIDYRIWNPETDPLIPANYSAQALEGKAICKTELLKVFGLPESGKPLPLIGIVSRLADQKGFDLIGSAIEEIAELDLRMVVLGTGQQKYHDLFQSISSRYPDKIGVRLAFDNKLAHLIEAGSDFFLMPSRYEPCGLNQLYSLRYGTVPVVRATGGLADTVTDCDAFPETGTGFSFTDYSAGAMMEALKRALAVYSDRERWKRLLLRDMVQDWSWEESARKYMRLYEEIHRRKSS